VDGDDVNFMDVTDFSQYSLQRQDIEDQMAYLIDGLEDITALLINDQIAAIELPQSVALKIVETTPAVKGASASARTKPATLETGLIVQVPEYITSGEVIKINTTNAKFMARA
jgi:elongation factor P